jgi:adenylate cyclase
VPRRADQAVVSPAPVHVVLRRRMERLYGPAMALANVVGAGVVFVFLTFFVPVTPDEQAEADARRLLNTLVFAAYILVSLVVGYWWGRRAARPLDPWLRQGRPVTPGATETALRLPGLQARINAVLWLVAAVVFGLLNTRYSLTLAVEVTGTIVLGGFTTCALGYLAAERTLRPVVGAAMAGSVAPPLRLLGVRARVLLAWALGTAVPLVGAALGLVKIGDREPLPQVAELFLLGVALLVGALAIAGAAGAVGDPVESVAAALREVGEGNLDVAVPVYDASEIGQLQSGFNAMVEGLRERERLRDLFGRQVGTDVARLALEEGVQLGGERRDVAVLFVDVIGSTGLAETLGPEEVVSRLNAFFAVVVEVVTRHGGWVNKFEGDAALCIFGAPAAVEDAPTGALRAARELIRGLAPLALDAAIGVSAGPVVAGHVGAESRFEYTVVGDPVNVAARLTDLAKADPTLVLAEESAVRRAAGEERGHWEPAGTVALRGRAAPTEVWRPRPPVS